MLSQFLFGIFVFFSFITSVIVLKFNQQKLLYLKSHSIIVVNYFDAISSIFNLLSSSKAWLLSIQKQSLQLFFDL